MRHGAIPARISAAFVYRPTMLYVQLPEFNDTIPTSTGTTPVFDEVEVGFFWEQYQPLHGTGRPARGGSRLILW